MKIQNSNIEMSSNHRENQIHNKSQSLQVWGDRKKMPSAMKKLADSLNSKDQLLLSTRAQNFNQQKKEALTEFKAQINATPEIQDSAKVELSKEDELKIRIIEDFFRILLHKKIKLVIPNEYKIKSANIDTSQISLQSASASKTQGDFGWGLRYNKTESYSESESMSFKSTGTINTADGKEISFDISLSMSRSFYTESNINIEAGDKPVDPLAINFDGNLADLSTTKFNFDIDCDGSEDQISALKEGSGFLSLDLNNDGIINDGSELFGPESGNGFEDLAKYDSDHNNWIDENDLVFDKLRIWTKDTSGNDSLFALGEKGIGAIYLGNISSQFTMKNNSNESLAEIKSTGLFVKEDGEVGTVQQIDYFV